MDLEAPNWLFQRMEKQRIGNFKLDFGVLLFLSFALGHELLSDSVA